METSRPGRLARLVTLALLASAVARAWGMRWVCDDAFISFRYARHLVEGHGLVWNLGERVEGFTNPLWTLLLAGAMSAGFDPVPASEALGVLGLAGLALALWRLETAAGPDGPPSGVAPALWACLAMGDLLEWSTGGLETMATAALAAGMAALLFAAGPGRAAEWGAGAAGALLFGVRPDAILIAGPLALVHAAARPAASRAVTLLRTLGPAVLAVAAGSAARRLYYGDWLPNTFYAKSVGSAWWTQGLFSLRLLAQRDYVLVLAPLLGAAAALLLRRRRRWLPLERPAAPASLLAAGLFGAYVVHTGGDFMFARRFVPAVPLFLFACLAPLRALSPRRALAASLVVVLAAALPLPIFRWWGAGGRIGSVADERAFYPPGVIALRQAQGEALGRALRDLPATVLIEGGLCVLAYYSGLPEVIEPNGLTDRTIARLPLAQRGVPGHEKGPDEAYLDARRVQFVVRQDPQPGTGRFDVVEIADPGLHLTMRFYDEPLMRQLAARPGVRFAPIEAVLSAAAAEIAAADCGHARELVRLLDRHYFERNASPAWPRAPLAEAAAARCAASP